MTLTWQSERYLQQVYMDDILSGAHSIEEVIHNRDELVYVLKSAGFLLRKWTSNEQSLTIRT